MQALRHRNPGGLTCGRLILHYHLTSFHLRRWSATAILMGVALVVGVFCYMLCFTEGLNRTLTITSDPHNLIVLAEGATAESNSAVTHEDAAKLSGVPYVAQDARGQVLVSAEVVVQTDLPRRKDRSGALASVAIRGVDLDVVLAVRPTVQLVAGRWFRPGADEVVVGQSAASRFATGTMGSAIDCGDWRFEVVGIFRTGGSAHESEIWGHVSNVASAYRRDMYSSAVIRLATTDSSAVQEVAARIASTAVALRAVREGAYYTAQTENARVIQSLTVLIVAIMSIGATFAAINAMHSTLEGRFREIGVLRALGFTRWTLIIGLVAESTTAAMSGGVLGCVLAAVFVALEGGFSDLVGTTTYASVAFRLDVRTPHIAYSLLVAVFIGLSGGFWPAYRATRLPVVHSLRIA